MSNGILCPDAHLFVYHRLGLFIIILLGGNRHNIVHENILKTGNISNVFYSKEERGPRYVAARVPLLE